MLGSFVQNSAPMSDDEDDVDSQLPILLPFLTKLHTLLRTCQYSEFWKTLDGKDEAAVGQLTLPFGLWLCVRKTDRSHCLSSSL
jgi:hypothetical protein